METTTASNSAQEEELLILQSFILRHAAHHRPTALVTSGGTAVDLDGGVRSLENFSTGLRGAISVELLLERGYAVVHLWRNGSASPFGRLLSQKMEIRQANQGTTMNAFATLFGSSQDGEDKNGGLGFLNGDWFSGQGESTNGKEDEPASDSSTTRLTLNESLSHDSDLLKAWRDYNQCVEKEGRLLTIPFRTVEEYLNKLYLCSTELSKCRSLGMCYLAAAVSDFYLQNKSEHKIQSRDYKQLQLTLDPVPKTLGKLRREWAPQAFCISFKLETDQSILRLKAEGAVEKYGVQMVVGNLLSTRHKVVWILHNDRDDEEHDRPVKDWPLEEVTKDRSSNDRLEEALIDFCVEKHFAHISRNYLNESDNKSWMEQHKLLQEEKRAIQRQLLRKRLQEGALQLGGTLLGMIVTYLISSTLQQRILQHSNPGSR